MITVGPGFAREVHTVEGSLSLTLAGGANIFWPRMESSCRTISNGAAQLSTAGGDAERMGSGDDSSAAGISRAWPRAALILVRQVGEQRSTPFDILFKHTVAACDHVSSRSSNCADAAPYFHCAHRQHGPRSVSRVAQTVSCPPAHAWSLYRTPVV